MSDQKGQEPSDHVDFENIELHSDVDVQRHRKKEPPPSRKAKKAAEGNAAVSGGGSKFLIAFLVLLLVAAAGGAGYFYTQLQGLLVRHETLETSHRELNDQIKAATDDLTDKSGSLEDAQKRLGMMSTSLKKLEEELATSQKKNQDLATKLANTETSKQKLDQELTQTKATLNSTRTQLQTTTSERDKLQVDLTTAKANAENLERELNIRIAGLENEMAGQQQAYQKEVTDFEQRISRLNGDLDKAKIDLERAQADARAEADASRKILQEAEQEKSKNATLAVEVERLSTELARVKNQVEDQQAIKTGELIAQIDEVEAPTVRYREPFPDTLRLPRGKQVAVRVLVTEVGNVSKAMIVPDQGLDAPTQQSLLRNIYLWKFTPPSYRGTRVQVWHTLMVSEQ